MTDKIKNTEPEIEAENTLIENPPEESKIEAPAKDRQSFLVKFPKNFYMIGP